VRISLAPILDFSLNCQSTWRNGCLLQKKFLASIKIQGAGVASAHTKYAQQ